MVSFFTLRFEVTTYVFFFSFTQCLVKKVEISRIFLHINIVLTTNYNLTVINLFPKVKLLCITVDGRHPMPAHQNKNECAVLN